MQTAEKARIAEANHDRKHDRAKPNWRMWGPYLSERQWGTVREDYSAKGDAWRFLTHDDARSKAYRWGEDGIGGLCDDHQILCFCIGLWNGKDPILKERLFGLTGPEGNHGEDVKELYYYLDGTPTSSYLKMLYKYPQSEFPYKELKDRNKAASKFETEVEILDTNAFDEGRYFDVFVEYAKVAIEDVFIRVTVHNRGPETASLTLLPQLWFRNTWSWGRSLAPKPRMELSHAGYIETNEEELGRRYFYADEYEGVAPSLLFCDNETNPARHRKQPTKRGYFKDAFHEYVVNGNHQAVNPNKTGTKSAAVYEIELEPGASRTIQLRLSDQQFAKPFADAEKTFTDRIAEADAFYDEIQSGLAGVENEDARLVQRQAFAGRYSCAPGDASVNCTK